MAYKKPEAKFPKSPQGLNDKKSNGQIARSIAVNNLYRLRTMWGNSEINGELIAGIEEEVKNGKYDNAIKLFNVIKETEAQNINLNGGIEVQKVFIDEKTQKNTDKHIDDFING